MKKRISFLLAAVLLLATLIPALPVLADGEEAVANTFKERHIIRRFPRRRIIWRSLKRLSKPE